MEEQKIKHPILFFGSKLEDRKVCFEAMNSGVDFEYLGASDDETPMILDGYTEYCGLEEIREYINGRKNK